MSARGPTALKASEGPRQTYVQGFVEQAQVYGAEEREGKSCCNVIAESILSLKLHLQMQVLYRKWGWMTNACISEVSMWTEAICCG